MRRLSDRDCTTWFHHIPAVLIMNFSSLMCVGLLMKKRCAIRWFPIFAAFLTGICPRSYRRRSRARFFTKELFGKVAEVLKQVYPVIGAEPDVLYPRGGRSITTRLRIFLMEDKTKIFRPHDACCIQYSRIYTVCLDDSKSHAAFFDRFLGKKSNS